MYIIPSKKFADDDHHVVEESALEGIFEPEEIHSIEKGNKQRDYSQSPPLVNELLLGGTDTFGGYKAYEHFDNFIWDKET